jgi:hypothetical protein
VVSSGCLISKVDCITLSRLRLLSFSKLETRNSELETFLSPAAAAALRTTKARRRSLVRLGRTTANRLTRDHYFPFLQVTFNNFGGRTVGQPNFDPPRLRFAILAQYPDQTSLAFKYGRTGWSKASLTTSPLTIWRLCVVTRSRTIRIAVLLPATLTATRSGAIALTLSLSLSTARACILWCETQRCIRNF